MTKILTLALLLATTPGLPLLAAPQGMNAAAQSVTQATEVIAGTNITIEKDGTVGNVVPDTALPEPIRQLLVKRVSQWRYEVPMWEGNPASVAHHLIVRLMAVPTTGGGFALRVSGLGNEWNAGSEFGPRPVMYPEAAMRQGIGGTFSYVVRIGQDGNVDRVRRLLPETVSDRVRKSLDEASRTALLTSRFRPFVVNGLAVACEISLPMSFIPPGKRDAPKEELPALASAALESPCPKPVLITQIENTLL